MSDERWELIEVFDGEEQVVGRYTDETRARHACMVAGFGNAPTGPDDIWGESDYFVRRAAERV